MGSPSRKTLGEYRLAHSDTPFHGEIQALDENFWQYYYAYQRDWLERGQINFQAVQSLWDILNNVYDNLDDLNVTLEELKPALDGEPQTTSHNPHGNLPLYWS
jgi:hypothetical protein